MTLKLNRVLEVLEVDVHSKFHQAKINKLVSFRNIKKSKILSTFCKEFNSEYKL